jgi:hypothetical protein
MARLLARLAAHERAVEEQYPGSLVEVERLRSEQSIAALARWC